MANTEHDQAQETGADRIAAFVLFFGLLAPIVGLLFGWDLALYLVELAGIAGGVAILVWNLGRSLPSMVRDALFIALAGSAIGLIFGWEQALVVVVAAAGSLIWQRWRDLYSGTRGRIR